MTITVKFFASLRERVGCGEMSLDTEITLTVGQIWVRLCDNLPMPANTLMAVNMEYVDADAVVTDGDEVAFFPPVTGG